MDRGTIFTGFSFLHFSVTFFSFIIGSYCTNAVSHCINGYTWIIPGFFPPNTTTLPIPLYFFSHRFLRHFLTRIIFSSFLSEFIIIKLDNNTITWLINECHFFCMGNGKNRFHFSVSSLASLLSSQMDIITITITITIELITMPFSGMTEIQKIIVFCY